MAADLTGKVVGVTADRRGDDQVVMFSRLGAEVLLGPTIATVKIPDPDLLQQRTRDLIADPPDYVIANTGIGMRTWIEAAAQWGCDEELTRALSRTRLVSRGPKASGALSSAGLAAWWRSPDEQLSDVVNHLQHQGIAGQRVALQLHGDDGAEFVARLEAAGAKVTTIPVYAWRPPEDPAPAHALIDRVCAGEVDALTFTAGPQIRSLLEMARTSGQKQELLTVVNQHVAAGCIGPVCAAVATDCGIERPVVPDNWRLGSLVKAVAEALS